MNNNNINNNTPLTNNNNNSTITNPIWANIISVYLINSNNNDKNKNNNIPNNNNWVLTHLNLTIFEEDTPLKSSNMTKQNSKRNIRTHNLVILRMLTIQGRIEIGHITLNSMVWYAVNF